MNQSLCYCAGVADATELGAVVGTGIGSGVDPTVGVDVGVIGVALGVGVGVGATGFGVGVGKAVGLATTVLATTGVGCCLAFFVVVPFVTGVCTLRAVGVTVLAVGEIVGTNGGMILGVIGVTCGCTFIANFVGLISFVTLSALLVERKYQ